MGRRVRTRRRRSPHPGSGIPDDGELWLGSDDGGSTWTAIPLPIEVNGWSGNDIGPAGILLAGQPSQGRGPLRDIIEWVSDLGRSDFDVAAPTVVGWSPDGERWDWQNVEDVFGAHGWPHATVGEDQVLVQFVDEAGEINWFVADVP